MFSERMQLENYEDAVDLLESFEAVWASGKIPDVFAFADRCPRDGFAATVSELIQIDLERRWKTGKPELRIDISKYLEVIPASFSDDEVMELVCWEYRIRNQWGDCISRKQICQNHWHLGGTLLDRLEDTAKLLEWPTVSIVVNGQTILEIRLDRDIEAGRQRAEDQAPWSILTNAFVHRINLSEARDGTLSRRQLALSLCSPDAVLLQNTSSNRAIAIRGHGAIDAGQSLICNLPVFVHLGASRYLRICDSALPLSQNLPE